MSLSATLTLDDASGDAIVYNQLFADSGGSKRYDVASTLIEPRNLVVKHSIQGSGADAIDRHLVQFTHTKVTTSGAPKTATVNLTLSIPRDSVITATIVHDLVANLVDLISDGGFGDSGFTGVTNLSAIARGEV
jgi:hypothetical protein